MDFNKLLESKSWTHKSYARTSAKASHNQYKASEINCYRRQYIYSLVRTFTHHMRFDSFEHDLTKHFLIRGGSTISPNAIGKKTCYYIIIFSLSPLEACYLWSTGICSPVPPLKAPIPKYRWNSISSLLYYYKRFNQLS